MICVDLARRTPHAVSLGDLDCFDLPRSGFRTKDAGEAREPVQSGRAPRVASKLARAQRFFNHLRMLTATSR